MRNETSRCFSCMDVFGISQESFVFFGTQAVGPGKGISVAAFYSVSGEITVPELSAETEAPAFFIIHPNGRYLYACNSSNSACGWAGETVSAFIIDQSNGRLTFINQQQSGGKDPNYLCIDNAARYLLVANYKGGNISVIEINPDGSLGRRTSFFQHAGSSVNAERQTQPYAHCIKLDPDNRFALVADLGIDKVFVYRFNCEDGTLRPNDPPFVRVAPGNGPRHFVFHPDNRFVYLVNEMGCSVTVFTWDRLQGCLCEIQTVPALPPGFDGENNSGDIMIHPDGRYLYVTNRGHDSITSFAIDANTGMLDYIGNVPAFGRKPRNLAIDPSKQWLIVANQNSGNVMMYRLEKDTGHLIPYQQPIAVPNPLYIGFLQKR